METQHLLTDGPPNTWQYLDLQLEFLGLCAKINDLVLFRLQGQCWHGCNGCSCTQFFWKVSFYPYPEDLMICTHTHFSILLLIVNLHPEFWISNLAPRLCTWKLPQNTLPVFTTKTSQIMEFWSVSRGISSTISANFHKYSTKN